MGLRVGKLWLRWACRGYVGLLRPGWGTPERCLVNHTGETMRVAPWPNDPGTTRAALVETERVACFALVEDGACVGAAAGMVLLLWILHLVGFGVCLCGLRGLLWLLVVAGFGGGLCVSARFRVPPGAAGASLAVDCKVAGGAVDGRQVGVRWNGCPLPRGAC